MKWSCPLNWSNFEETANEVPDLSGTGFVAMLFVEDPLWPSAKYRYGSNQCCGSGSARIQYLLEFFFKLKNSYALKCDEQTFKIVGIVKE
jgi:hypothetical protein